MTPRFLEFQLNQSRENLGLETIDLMYLHNAAESQLAHVGRHMFLNRLREAFTFYESARAQNQIRYYGMATWDCFRLPPDETERYLDLESVIQIAQEVGGTHHGFRFIQVPFNFAFLEALLSPNQPVRGSQTPLFHAAQALGLSIFTSVPLMQGHLLNADLNPIGNLTPAQTCLQIARSTPGVTAPLVGHKQANHVEENLALAAVPPLTSAEYQHLLSHQPA
jgi:aryl-alcohol dehydrogenase-like predicted oxidoreductase